MPPEIDALLDLNITFKRMHLENEIKKHIRNGEPKTILIKTPAGTGKTCTISKVLFSRDDIFVIWLSPRHEQAEKDVVKFNLDVTKICIFHLKGRKQPGMCLNIEALDQIPDESNINPDDTVCFACPHHVEDYDCLYYHQFALLKSDLQSFVTVHHFLPKKTVLDYFNEDLEGHIPVLVLDEYFVPNITTKVKINRKNLEALAYALTEILPSHSSKIENAVEFFQYCILTLKYMLTLTNKKEGMSGLNFVKNFAYWNEKYIESDRENRKKKGVETFFDSRIFLEEEEEYKYIKETFINKIFYPKLTEKIINGEGKDLKNVLHEILEIARTCFKIYDNNQKDDLNLPFFSAMGTEENNFERCIQFTKAFRDFPTDVLTFILDATGDKDFYSFILGREVETYEQDFGIERKIYQVTDGFYWKEYMKHKDDRNRLFLDIYTIINHHLEKGEKIVNVITYKFLEKELKHYLEKKGFRVHVIQKNETENVVLENAQVRIGHFGGLRGTNIMKGDNILIIAGTPAPNVFTFPLEVGAWYSYEEPIIGNEKDSRYMMHLRMAREHEIEQLIDRLRQIYGGQNKVVYLFSKLKIAYETEKIKRKELMDKFLSDERRLQLERLKKLQLDRKYIFLKHVDPSGRDALSDVYQKNCNVKPFKNNIESLKKIRDYLVKNKFLKVNELRKVELTEKGKNYMDSIELEIEKLIEILDILE